MDYVVFIVDEDRKIRYYGRIDSVNNLSQAKRKLKNIVPNIRNAYLVKTTNFNKVDA